MHDEPGYWMSEGTQYHLLRVRDQLRLLATLATPRAREEGAMGMPAIPYSSGRIACSTWLSKWMMCWRIWAPPGNTLSWMQARRHVIKHASSHRQAT